jgi:DNA polymerase I
LGGEVRSFCGRLSRYGAPPKYFGPRAYVLSSAVKFSVFGTAADIIKLALVRLHNALPPDCRMLLPVHNSILLEIPSERAKQALPLVREVLEEPPPDFSIPLAVKMTWDRTWADL